MSYAKIRPRRGTADQWYRDNPILFEGEFVIEHPGTGVGTGLCKFKIGDGLTPYRELPYAFDGAAANAIMGGSVDSFHLIQFRSGTSEEWETVNPILERSEVAYDTTFNSLKIGDGVTPWNDLKYINSQDAFSVSDYGDEDATEETETASTFAMRRPVIEEPVEVTDGTATIADLIPNAEEEVILEEAEEIVEEVDEEPIDTTIEEEVIEDEVVVEEEETSIEDEDDPLYTE